MDMGVLCQEGFFVKHNVALDARNAEEVRIRREKEKGQDAIRMVEDFLLPRFFQKRALVHENDGLKIEVFDKGHGLNYTIFGDSGILPYTREVVVHVAKVIGGFYGIDSVIDGRDIVFFISISRLYDACIVRR